jgi:hypothetical protein
MSPSKQFVYSVWSRVFTQMRGQWATKRARLRKKPYNPVLTAASIAASKEFKKTACRADLMCCCVLLPKSQLLPQKICCVISAWCWDLATW